MCLRLVDLSVICCIQRTTVADASELRPVQLRVPETLTAPFPEVLAALS
jgi:hypothetical protein